MQNLFDEVGSLDKRCYSELGLSEELLMEHAANGMAEYIKTNFSSNAKVTIVCGSGNNGADGLVLARLLHLHFDVTLLLAKPPKSAMAQLQHKRTQALNIKEADKLQECDVLVDALLGTGFKGELDERLTQLMEKMNQCSAFKIACDVPSAYLFKADITLTMGAMKKSLFLDNVKDIVGEIHVLDLGLHRTLYEKDSNTKLLDIEDLKLPFRTAKNSHKGSFGHLSVACGDKSGASIMSALAAVHFGAGLVSLITHEKATSFPHAIMSASQLPNTTTAIACGMGLGNEFSDKELALLLENEYPLILDADIFSMDIILKLLKRESLVLTPHPKEFVSLLRLTELADISVETLQAERFKYAELFAHNYPNAVLLLKGANVIITHAKQVFVNPHGTAALAKGGSGDVLSGLIGSLLAQGYSALDAAIHGSLSHTKLAQNYKGADFSLTPDDLIAGIAHL